MYEILYQHVDFERSQPMVRTVHRQGLTARVDVGLFQHLNTENPVINGVLKCERLQSSCILVGLF